MVFELDRIQRFVYQSIEEGWYHELASEANYWYERERQWLW